MDLVTQIRVFLELLGPYKVIGGTVLLVLFLQYLRSAFRTRYHESAREKVGRLAVSIPFVRAQYLKQFHKDLVTFQEKSQKRWETFGAPITELPEDGWTPASIKQWFDRLVKVTNRPLEHHQYSGMIYSNSINDSGDAEEIKEVDVEYMQHDLTTPEAMSALSAELKELYTYTFRKSYLWNQLHGNEFGIGDWMSYQVVQMVSTMFGGNPSECNGFVTTGGTESLMVAMRSYRNWGMMSRGLAPGESTIICADTIHAAVKKAGDAYHMHTILVPTSDDGDMDLAAMRAAIKKHGRNVVCVIGSAPNYPTGVLDPIAELAAIAKEFGIGLHVDACLGGFIVNNLPSIDANFLAIDGVTSLSTDTHKNGWAPKGSSVLVTKPLYNPVHGNINMAFYSIYTMPGWTGGAYGTPKDAGSVSCVNILHAMVALLHIGKNGYRQMAEGIHATTQEMAAIMDKYPPLEVLRPVYVNLVSCRISKDSEWGPTAIYAFAHEMDTRGFVFSGVKGNILHFCVTARLSNNKHQMAKFNSAVKDAMGVVAGYVPKVLAGEAQFPGDAGLYGMLEAAMEPGAAKEISYAKFAEMWLLGNQGANDAIKAYFMAVIDPYSALPATTPKSKHV